jgi:hypothetical protein
LDYRASFGTALDLMQRSAQLMSLFLPGHEMQEAKNKIEAFRLFAYADQELHFPTDRVESLDVLTRRALALSNYRKIWALEGVAHYCTGVLNPNDPATGFLANPELPECTMVPMHAGMGTSFAGTVLSRLGDTPSKSSVRDAMERFFGLCRDNARPGWHENAIEPIGLGVRSLHPHLLRPVSDAIGEMDAEPGKPSQRLFWHGVGRSLYFVPMNFVTFGGSHERALRTAIAEAPTPEDRENAVAGLVWAVTLVNICHPAVLKSMLNAGAAIRMPGAVKNGIVSALMIWKHMVPEDREFLPEYLRAATGNSADARLWNEFVVTPAQRAFSEVFPDLNERGRIASLFLCRPTSL